MEFPWTFQSTCHVRPAGLAAKHSIAYLVITGEDRYIGFKKTKSTKPRFYDGELQTLLLTKLREIETVYEVKLDFVSRRVSK